MQLFMTIKTGKIGQYQNELLLFFFLKKTDIWRQIQMTSSVHGITVKTNKLILDVGFPVPDRVCLLCQY